MKFPTNHFWSTFFCKNSFIHLAFTFLIKLTISPQKILEKYVLLTSNMIPILLFLRYIDPILKSILFHKTSSKSRKILKELHSSKRAKLKNENPNHATHNYTFSSYSQIKNSPNSNNTITLKIFQNFVVF